MQSKPRKKLAPATVEVEAVRGVQLTSDGETLEILDLHGGQFATVRVNAAKHPGRIRDGRAGWLLSLPCLAGALPSGIPGLSGDRFVTVGELRAALSSSPERPSPPFPCPSAARVRGICFPAPWERLDEGDVGRILAVALALAWRGGRAYDVELEGDLAGRLGGRPAARAAMDEALRRSGGNICREGHGNFAVWRMREEWKWDDPNELPVARSSSQGEETIRELFENAGVLRGLFDGESDE